VVQLFQFTLDDLPWEGIGEVPGEKLNRTWLIVMRKVTAVVPSATLAWRWWGGFWHGR